MVNRRPVSLTFCFLPLWWEAGRWELQSKECFEKSLGSHAISLETPLSVSVGRRENTQPGSEPWLSVLLRWGGGALDKPPPVPGLGSQIWDKQRDNSIVHVDLANCRGGLRTWQSEAYTLHPSAGLGCPAYPVQPGRWSGQFSVEGTTCSHPPCQKY